MSFRTEKVSSAKVVVNAGNDLGGTQIEFGTASAAVEVTTAPTLDRSHDVAGHQHGLRAQLGSASSSSDDIGR
jgi:hypothetical protein